MVAPLLMAAIPALISAASSAMGSGSSQGGGQPLPRFGNRMPLAGANSMSPANPTEQDDELFKNRFGMNAMQPSQGLGRFGG